MKKNLIPILIIVITTGICLLLITKSPKESYFNRIVLNDSTNTVVNGTDKPYLDTILYLGLTELNIQDVVINVYSLTEEVKQQFSSEMDLKGHIVSIRGNYIIWIDNLDREEMIEIMSHELIHIKQYESGDLVIVNGIPVWKGKKVVLGDYESREWEKEGVFDGEKLEQKIRKILN